MDRLKKDSDQLKKTVINSKTCEEQLWHSGKRAIGQQERYRYSSHIRA